MFSYIAKLTRKICNMKEYTVNNDYKEFMADDVLISNDKLSNYTNIFFENSSKYMDNYFEPNTVKKGAKYINNFVQDLMDKYFGIK